jgi:hypothetical protein
MTPLADEPNYAGSELATGLSALPPFLRAQFEWPERIASPPSSFLASFEFRILAVGMKT